MEKFLAHIRDDNGEVQTINEHLKNTGSLAAQFAADPFRPLAEYAGLIHDIGKYRDGFQNRIQGKSSLPCEHACIAAQERYINVKTAARPLMCSCRFWNTVLPVTMQVCRTECRPVLRRMVHSVKR